MPGGFMNRTRISRLAVAALAGGLAIGIAGGTTHDVVKGDTMWDITGHYLGNPFLWPSIWKINPQIKDAHWIYPGDTIHLDTSGQRPGEAGKSMGGESGEVVSRQDNGPDPLGGFELSPGLQQVPNLDSNSNGVDLIVPATKSYLSEAVMLMAPVLVPTSQSGKSSYQGRILWDPDYGQQEVLVGTNLGTDVGSDQGLKVGDRVVIVESGDQVSTLTVPELSGHLEQARAIAVVLEVRQKSSEIQTERVFGRITRSAIVRPLEIPAAPYVVGFKKVDENKPDQVLANTRLGRTQMPGSYILVGRGEASGVSAGDVFEFMDPGLERGITAMRGYGLVVRTTATTSTVVLVGTTPKPILPGDNAWRIRAASHG
jgi:hypothetical protein